MTALLDSGPVLQPLDTAISDTAKDLRKELQAAIDPPDTSRRVRREDMRRSLWRDVAEFVRGTADYSAKTRLMSSVWWSEHFIDTSLATGSAPEIAIDNDGEVLFEWLNGPRDVVTVSIGPAGIVNFASLTGAGRFHGVTRLGSRTLGPLTACLASVGEHSS